MKTFANACEQALKSSNRTYKKSSGNFIHSVEIVSGIPIYGYHETEQEFLKIYLYNPIHVGVLSDILVHGVVLGTVFQPHESHIPFIMQFLIDFNLYGMNFIHFSEAIMRVEKAEKEKVENCSLNLSKENSQGKDKSLSLVKQSISELELDTFACCILSSGSGSSERDQKEKFCNPGLRAIWEDELIRQKLATGNPCVRISNPVSPPRPTQENDDLESELLSELRTGLKSVFESQSLDFVTPKTQRKNEDLELELCTPRKLDFDLGKAKASSTPFVGAQKVPEQTPQKPIEVEIPESDGSSFNVADVLSLSVAKSDMVSMDCASLVDFLQNDSQIMNFTQNEIAEVSNRIASQVRTDSEDEDDQPFSSNKDVSKLESLVKDAKRDEAETWDLSQIVEYPRDENEPDDGSGLTQMDGNNIVVISDDEEGIDARLNSRVARVVTDVGRNNIVLLSDDDDSKFNSKDVAFEGLDRKSLRLLKQMKSCSVVIEDMDLSQCNTFIHGGFSVMVTSSTSDNKLFRGSGRYRPEIQCYDASTSSSIYQPKVALNATTIEDLENSRAELEHSHQTDQTIETLYEESVQIDENSPIAMEGDYMAARNPDYEDNFWSDNLDLSGNFVAAGSSRFVCNLTPKTTEIENCSRFLNNQSQSWHRSMEKTLNVGTSETFERGKELQALEKNLALTNTRVADEFDCYHNPCNFSSEHEFVEFNSSKNGLQFSNDIMNASAKQFLTKEGNTLENETCESICSSDSTKTMSTLEYEFMESNSPVHFGEDEYIPDSPELQPVQPRRILAAHQSVTKANDVINTHEFTEGNNIEKTIGVTEYDDAIVTNVELNDVIETTESLIEETPEESDATLDEIGLRMIFEDMQRQSNDLVDKGLSPAGSGSFQSEAVFTSGDASPEFDENSKSVKLLTFANLPPTRSHVMQTLAAEGLHEVDNDVHFDIVSELQPFHSQEQVSEKLKNSRRIILTPALLPPVIRKSEVVNKVIQSEKLGNSGDNDESELNSTTIKGGNEGDHSGASDTSSTKSRPNSPSMFYSFMPPPSNKTQASADVEVLPAPLPTQFSTGFSHTGISVQSNDKSMNNAAPNLSPVDYPCHRLQYLTVMSMELHVVTRASLLPNPMLDQIAIIFYSVFRDDQQKNKGDLAKGVVIIDSNDVCKNNRVEALCERNNLDCRIAASEIDLIMDFSTIVKKLNPDILVGFEVQNMSWGYLLKRGKTLLIDTIASMFSRMPDLPDASHFDKSRDAYGADEMSEINLAGRIVLNLWRIMKWELPLRSFTFETVYFEVMKKRVPRFIYEDLTKWCNPYADNSNSGTKQWYKTFDHLLTRCQGNLQILSKLNLITRTSEMSRLFGILFFEVLTRGSQFRVESMLIRSAKSNNFIAASPSIYQRAKARAPEHIQLVLEPESAFYSDPVLVLDFQSLYPSMMIAYNYCYTTCLGRVDDLKNELGSIFKLGCLPYSLPPQVLKELIRKRKVHVAPNGVAFVDQSVRKGLISKMVEDILNTRIMVKRFMKQYKKDPVMYGMLDARQLGLKLIANVTYGYTGANFSGRMPCVEIADTIVRKARETLEKSIDVVNSNPRWNARVIYGDTDSMFVLLRGATKETAFKVGQEISDVITQLNPKPVKLKFEKVYYPCVLITKKRYVGYSYETLEQKEPDFDAKGIETVRRDNCPVVGKVLEKTLRILFETKDMAAVKSYVQRQLSKVTHERVGLDDFVFGKEFRGRDRYKPGAYIAALRIADKLLVTDPMAEPLRGERVPYCIVYDSPGLPLYQLIRSPDELIKNPMLRINSFYYITKQILPPLDRVLGLVRNCSVFDWFKELPVYKNQMTSSIFNLMPSASTGSRKRCNNMISFVETKSCASCFERKCSSRSVFCDKCVESCQHTAWSCNMRVAQNEKISADLKRICISCSGHSPYVESCQNFNCPVFQKLMLTRKILSVQYNLLPVLSTKL